MSIWDRYFKDKIKREKKEEEARNNLMANVKPKWQYFSHQEVMGMSDDIVYKLDRARDLYGNPIVITSGFRTEDQNDIAGGVKGSAHLTGQAADISAPDESFLREKLIWALGAAGFRRLGLYEKHFHVDVDHTKPFPAVWHGEYT